LKAFAEASEAVALALEFAADALDASPPNPRLSAGVRSYKAVADAFKAGDQRGASPGTPFSTKELLLLARKT
jgi:hypothetical protein